MARIYDPLGLASPITLVGKQLYQDIHDTKLASDRHLQDPFFKRWKDWLSMLTETFRMPSPVTAYHEPISQLTLDAFSDASSKGVCSAVFQVVHRAQGTTQKLISSKSRLAKKNLSIPRDSS